MVDIASLVEKGITFLMDLIKILGPLLVKIPSWFVIIIGLIIGWMIGRTKTMAYTKWVKIGFGVLVCIILLLIRGG